MYRDFQMVWTGIKHAFTVLVTSKKNPDLWAVFKSVACNKNMFSLLYVICSDY